MTAHAIVLDVDTGIDDALAILYAVAHPDIEVLGISCTAGNTTRDQVVTNTLRVLDAAGAPEIPVAAGATKPLVGPVRPPGTHHGADGLGGIELPASGRTPSPLTAVELLRRQVLGAGRPVTLVGLAPQTTVAMLLTLHPEVAGHLERIVVMGGSTTGGNATAVAEFNVWSDPEAAAATVGSGVPVTMYGLDVFSRLPVPQATAERWKAGSHSASRLAGNLLLHRRDRTRGSDQGYVGLIGDAGTLVHLTRPDLFVTARHPTRVNLEGLGRGQTIVDRRPVAQDQSGSGDPWPVVEVVLDLETTQAAEVFTAVVDTYAA